MGLLLGALLSPLLAALAILLFLSSLLVYIPMAFFNWAVTAPISFIHEPVVTTGWALSRDLINIVFVIVLVVIGLATVLGLENLAAKKALPMLIIAAILINFSPVICGVFIDLANILMNIFKEPALNIGNTLGAMPIQVVTFIQNEFFKLGKDPISFLVGLTNISSTINFLGLLIAGILFNVVIFTVLGAYALIFTFRIMVLWILVILSPFAVLSYCFPRWPIIGDIKKKWTGPFLQWTFIGVPLFFFLYLAQEIMNNPVCSGSMQTGGNVFTTWLSGTVMCSLLSLIFPSLFLILGVFFTFQISTNGANAVTGGITKWATKQGANLKNRAWAHSKSFVAQKAPKSWNKALTNMAIDPTLQARWGEGDNTRAGGIKRFGARWANSGLNILGTTRQAAGRAGMGLTGSNMADIAAAKKLATGIGPDGQVAKFNDVAATPEERTGALQAMIADKNLAKNIDKLSDTLLKATTEFAKKNHSDKDISKALLHLNKDYDLGDKIDPNLNGRAKKIATVAYFIKQSAPSDIEKLPEEAWGDPDVVRAFIEQATTQQINTAMKEFKNIAQVAIQKSIDDEKQYFENSGTAYVGRNENNIIKTLRKYNFSNIDRQK